MTDRGSDEGPERSEPDEQLLSILACPACHEDVEPRGDMLVCTGCGRGYPVRDGIPVMLLEEATPPTESPHKNGAQ